VVRGRQSPPSPVSAPGEQARLAKTVKVQELGGNLPWIRPSVPGHGDVSKASAGGFRRVGIFCSRGSCLVLQGGSKDTYCNGDCTLVCHAAPVTLFLLFPGAKVLCCKDDNKTCAATGSAHLYAMPPQLPSSSFFQGLKSSAARGTQRLVLQRGMHSCMPCRPSYPLPPSRLSQPPARSEVGVVVILVTITPGIAIDWVAGRSHSPRARWLNVQSGQRKRLRRERCPCDRWY